MLKTNKNMKWIFEITDNTYRRIKTVCELLERCERFAELDIWMFAVQEHTEDRLSGAGVVDYLRWKNNLIEVYNHMIQNRLIF